MPSSNQLQILIAHYLSENYPTVLEPFLTAAHLPHPDPTSPPNPDLRTLLADWRSYQLAQEIGSIRLSPSEDIRSMDGSWKGWNLKDMINVELGDEVRLGGLKRTIEGVTASNLLAVGVLKVPKREFNLVSASYQASYPLSLVTTSVDKSLKIIDYKSGEVDRILQPHQAAILSFAFHPLNPRYLLTGSMDGSAVLTDLITSQPLQTFKHSKFVVRVAFSPDGRFIATASYDHSIVIYEAISGTSVPPQNEDSIPIDEGDSEDLACDPELRYEERRRIRTDSNPEAILFHPDSKYLTYTVRSSHLLFYISLPPKDVLESRMNTDESTSDDVAGISSWSTLTKSFNPHPMDSHVSFSVLNMVLHPSGRIIACQTGDGRGGTGERILLYGVEPEETERLACLWTGTDGDDFVLPRMAWLPDGSGIVTTTSTGFLKLVSLNGEVRSSLKVHGASELGVVTSEVVRDCCIVELDEDSENDGKKWEIVSVGYDRRVRISR